MDKNLANASADLFLAVLSLGCTALVAFQGNISKTDEHISFTDVTRASGLNFQQSYGDRHLDNIVEGTGTGVCVFDYNNDGFLDIYFPNGKWTEGSARRRTRIFAAS